MRAELRRLHSPDVEDLTTWTPQASEFAILLQIMAGPEGAPGEESFDVTLCTPAWIASRVATDKIMDGRHLLIVARYDYPFIYRYISDYVSSCEGDTWQEVAARISRLGRWEFEDYRA
jgi:hypothetical protein